MVLNYDLSLNQRAVQFLNKLIERCEKNNSGTLSAKIGNDDDGFMPVHVEIHGKIDFSGYPAKIVSVSHYFKQNGDLVPDPDMQFIVLDDFPNSDEFGLPIFPQTFQNQFRYDQAIFQDDDTNKWYVNRTLLSSLVSFANMWMNNIAAQQDL